MTTYTTLPQDDQNLEVEVTESNDLVTLNIQPAAVTLSGLVQSVNGESGIVTLDTDDIDEGATNLYYTGERVDDQVNTLLQAGNGIRLDYNDEDGELEISSEQMEETVKNASGAEITKGTPVYQTGVSGNFMTVAPADASDSNKMPAVGVLGETLADEAEGKMLIVGRIRQVDTSSFTAGDVVYVAPGGGYTNTRPSSANHLVQNLGRVTKVAVNGEGIVYGAGRSNDIPNLATGHVFIGDGSGYEARALTTDDVSEGANLYYTQTRFDSAFAAKTTSDLTEGTNLYYTTSRANADFDTRLATKSTTDLTEGTNLYYTDARVQTVIDTNTAGFITASSTDTLTNKSGNISQWTNDAGYITEAEDNQTLSFASPNLSISAGNTVDISPLLTGYATEAYVDQAEADANTYADGVAATAESNANTYTDNTIPNSTIDGGTF